MKIPAAVVPAAIAGAALANMAWAQDEMRGIAFLIAMAAIVITVAVGAE